MADLTQARITTTAVEQAGSASVGRRPVLANALIITRREVRDSFRDWRIVAPIILLTFFFPFLAQGVANSFANFLRGYGAQLIGERTIPFLLMIVGFFPISISLVIALETFVGEKERRSLEPLLSTPLTNTELYIGKTLAAMIPPLIASFGGMSFYMLTLLGGELVWRPQPMLIVQIFALTVIQALVMVTGAVVVSSQTTSTRAANLLASFIIIPMTLVINGESIIMFMAPDAESPSGIGALWAIMVGMFIVVLLLLRMGNAIFNREELLGRTIDQINLIGTLKKIGRYIRATDDAGTMAPNLLVWYQRAIPYSLRKLGVPALIALLAFIVAFGAGYIFGTTSEYQLPLPSVTNADYALQLFDQFQTSSGAQQALGFILWQNGRLLLLTMLLAIFSFGIAPLVITPIVYAVLGYLLSQIVLAGYDPALFWSAVLPHGFVEIPVTLLAAAMLLRLGAVVTRPPRGTTLGHAWIVAFSDAIKLGLGLILPGLIVAALLEVYLTPAVVRLTLGG